MNNIVTKSEFSRMQGVNRSTVTRWDKAGRLVLAPNGKVKVAESLVQIKATQGARTDVSERHAQARGQAIPAATSATTVAPTRPTDLDDPDMQVNEGDIGEDRAHYKAIALDFGNQQLRLDQALKDGKRLDADGVKNSVELLGHQLRGAVERLIDNLSPQISSQSNHAARSERIKTEVDALIQTLK